MHDKVFKKCHLKDASEFNEVISCFVTSSMKTCSDISDWRKVTFKVTKPYRYRWSCLFCV